MAAMTSFHAEQCCHLVCEHEASAGCLCSSLCQYKFVLVSLKLLLADKDFADRGLIYVMLVLICLHDYHAGISITLPCHSSIVLCTAHFTAQRHSTNVLLLLLLLLLLRKDFRAKSVLYPRFYGKQKPLSVCFHSVFVFVF